VPVSQIESQTVPLTRRTVTSNQSSATGLRWLFALRLSATTIDALRELAPARGTTISELVRGWIVDRLAVEALQPAGADPAVWAATTRAALEAVPQIAAETADRLAKAG